MSTRPAPERTRPPEEAEAARSLAIILQRNERRNKTIAANRSMQQDLENIRAVWNAVLYGREHGVEHCKGKPARPKPKRNPGSLRPPGDRHSIPQKKTRHHSRWLWFAPVWCGIVLGVISFALCGIEAFAWLIYIWSVGFIVGCLKMLLKDVLL